MTAAVKRALKIKLLPVAKLTDDLIPEDLQGWIKSAAERMDKTPPDYVAAAALMSLCALVGRRVGIHPKKNDDWLVVPNTFGMAVGDPSVKKSPSQKEGARFLAEIDRRKREEYEAAVKEHALDKEYFRTLYETARDKAKKEAKSGEQGAAKQTLRDAQQAEEPAPTYKRHLITDATVEKLMEIQRDNPMGLLVLRDELSGWLSQLEREDRQSDRSYYLEGWNGTDSFSYDRIGRGSGYVESNTISVFGGIQPAKLDRYLRDMETGSGDDGFLQRFQIAVYPDKTPPTHTDTPPLAAAVDKARRVFTAIESIPDHDGSAIKKLRFNADGQGVFDDWYGALLAETHEEPNRFVQAHKAKYSSLMPSLALVFQLITDSNSQCVELDAALMAVRWCHYLESHARRIYGLGGNSTLAIMALLERLNDLDMGGFKTKDITDKGWSTLTDTKQVNLALDVLVDVGLIIKEVGQTGGRPSVTFFADSLAGPIAKSVVTNHLAEVMRY